MRRRDVTIIVVAAAAILILGLVTYEFLYNKPAGATRNYTYKVINAYPHDRNAFTEGLVYENGVLYESTGLYGESTLRCVGLENGTVLQSVDLSNQYFGEGITIFGDKIIQLTWREHTGFVFDKSSFNLLQEFNYTTEGWGITQDGSRLIMSDGSATLHFLNPETFEETGTVSVTDNGVPVTKLNELEYINGEVYANIWYSDKIAIINPQTGVVRAWLNMQGIRSWQNLQAGDVLNGIAYDSAGNRLFVTGKDWSLLFQIELVAS